MNGKQKPTIIDNIFDSKARLKILKILAINEEMSISSIISETKLNHSNVIKHLNILKELNLIQEKNFGRIRIFRYKIENIQARSFKNFIEIWEGAY